MIVNVVCAGTLGKAHHGTHDHHHGEAVAHEHHHGNDLNLRSAYPHVIADAATAVLAIAALAGGWLLGWSWLDPVMGLLGAVIVALWAPDVVRRRFAQHEEIVHSTVEVRVCT